MKIQENSHEKTPTRYRTLVDLLGVELGRRTRVLLLKVVGEKNTTFTQKQATNERRRGGCVGKINDARVPQAHHRREEPWRVLV